MAKTNRKIMLTKQEFLEAIATLQKKVTLDDFMELVEKQLLKR